MLPFMSIFLLALLLSPSTSDDECTKELAALGTCLPYLSDFSETPSSDCCHQLQQVVIDSKRCLCLMIKNRYNPTPFGKLVNVTKAVIVPTVCHSPTNVSECTSILHLSPNSTEAKDFDQVEQIIEAFAPSPSVNESILFPPPPSPEAKSDSGKGKTRMGMLEKACVFILMILTCWNFL